MNAELDKLTQQLEALPNYNSLLFPIWKQIVRVLLGMESRIRDLEKRNEDTEG